MRRIFKLSTPAFQVMLASLALASGAALAQSVALKLNGDAEVPPVKTVAQGSGSINVAADMSVSGSIATAGISGTMAHIHMAPAGKNGGVIIPLMQAGDGKWAVPAGAKLTDAQYQAFKAGGLYVNVHSATAPGGEIRAQIQP
jgi:hypothetical protein